MQVVNMNMFNYNKCIGFMYYNNLEIVGYIFRPF